MAGTSVSSGAEYQAAVAAYVAVRMILERPLNWRLPQSDVPVAVAGEVGGPGDDLEIELDGGVRLGVQCKRSLVGVAALRAALEAMVERGRVASNTSDLILLVGPGSSPEIRDSLATDVRNFRQGRPEVARSITKAVLSQVDGADNLFQRLFVVALDVDRDSDTGAQFAIDGLRQALVDPDKAAEAWGLLVRNALKLAQKGRWTRAEVVSLLLSHGLKLRPLGVDAAWIERIEFAQSLNERWRQRTAAGVLDALAGELDGESIAGETLRRLRTARGLSALGLGDFARAKTEFARAIDLTPATLEPGSPEEVRKTWCGLRATYAHTLRFLDDADGAVHWAQSVLAVDPNNARAWSVLVQTGTNVGRVPPASVIDSHEYREALAQKAMELGDWRAAADVLADKAMSTERRPIALNLYGQALLNMAVEDLSGQERTSTLERAERAADDGVRVLEDGELDKFLAMLVFLRGRARELLGRSDDARADYNRAAVLDPTEPNILSQVVRDRLGAGEGKAALALLTDEIVEVAPALRVLRADLRSKAEDVTRANADLAAAIEELPARATRAFVELYLRIAGLALENGALEVAERALDALSGADIGDNEVDAGVLRGRLAVANKKLDDAEREYRSAAERASPPDRSQILAELAANFGRAGLADRAVAVFEEAGASAIEHPAFSNFVTALMKAGMFERVADLAASKEREAIEAGGVTSDLPPRLLDAAIHVAWRREDHAVASRLFDARIDQQRKAGAVELSTLLGAAMEHADNGNGVRAGELVNEVLASPALPPEDRMRAANVLAKLGASKRAIDTAFAAVRLMPSDRRMVGNFMQLVVTPSLKPAGSSKREERSAEDWSAEAGDSATSDGFEDEDIGEDGRRGEVAPDCFVGCVTQDGQQISYFIYREAPVDARLSEFVATDPVVADLIGRRVGDVVVRNAGSWHEQRLRIARVLPAVVVVFRRYLRTFSAQFPDEPMIRAFKVGPKITLESLGPILAVMHAGQEEQKRRLAIYDQTPLPLGVLAEFMGKRIVEVASIVAGASSARRLWVDGAPFTEYSDGIQAALAAKTIVLTQPALHFVSRLGLFDVLAKRYRLVVPKAMADEWKEELNELRQMAAQGRSFMRESGGRPVLEELSPEAGRAALTQRETLFDQVMAVAEIRVRPASALGEKDSEWRKMLGDESFDALAIGRAEAIAVYADDLGLRAVGAKEFHVQSFATASLLDAMRAEGLLTPAEFERNIIKLIEWGHDRIPIRAATIAAVFSGEGTLSASARLVLDRLADSAVTPSSAAVVAAAGLAEIAKATIIVAPLDSAATQVVEALVRHRRPQEIIPYFLQAVSEFLALSPYNLRQITDATTKVVKRL